MTSARAPGGPDRRGGGDCFTNQHSSLARVRVGASHGRVVLRRRERHHGGAITAARWQSSHRRAMDGEPTSPPLGLSWTPIPEIDPHHDFQCALTTVAREGGSSASVRSAGALFRSALEDEARRRDALVAERRTLVERTSEVESELRGIADRERQLDALLRATEDFDRAPWTPISRETFTMETPALGKRECAFEETPTRGGVRFFGSTISPKIVSTTVSALRRRANPSLLTVSDVRKCAMRSWSVLRELHPHWNLPHTFRFSDEWCVKNVMSRLQKGSAQSCSGVSMPVRTKNRKRSGVPRARIDAPPRDEKRQPKPNPKFEL